MSSFVYLRVKTEYEENFSEVYLNLDDIAMIIPSSKRVVPERCIDQNEAYEVHPDDMVWLKEYLGKDKVAFALLPGGADD